MRLFTPESAERCEGDAAITVQGVSYVPLASSEGLGWSGFQLVAGVSGPCTITSESVEQRAHQLVMNLGQRPLLLEARGEGRFTRQSLAPGGVWLLPAEEDFVHHAPRGISFARLSIAPTTLDGFVGRSIRLKAGALGDDTPLQHVLRALVSEARGGGAGGVAFAETLVSAISLSLARRHAEERPAPPRARGGLAPHHLRRVVELIDARLGDALSLKDMASEAGLSPFHFARQFRHTTGTTPHRFLLKRRLERARRLLEQRELNAGAIAADVGFLDQSHFTRAFKREYGVTPGALARAQEAVRFEAPEPERMSRALRSAQTTVVE